MKTPVLLNNGPAHPEAEKMMSDNKKIKCMLIVANTTFSHPAVKSRHHHSQTSILKEAFE